ncbi:MAG: hypothetical protein Q4A16_07740 [Lautropia sp.]|nr:hypothetical protein [Lautropia sp.]
MTDSSPPIPRSRQRRSTSRERLVFVQPVRIASDRDALAGLFQPASGKDTAVLICNPFGQEAIRAQRSLRVVSERLGRHGVPSLRFDYYGTGDSPGDDGEGRMSRWRLDIHQADARLRELTGCRSTIWLGLRMGATLALQAADRTADAPLPRRIILWEPVLNGGSYLQHLSRMHEYWTRRSNIIDEALGFRIPDHLRVRWKEIQPDTFALPRHVSLDLVAHDALPGRLDFLNYASARTSVTEIPLETVIEWTSNTALASQWVPDDAIAALLDICTHPAS